MHLPRSVPKSWIYHCSISYQCSSHLCKAGTNTSTPEGWRTCWLAGTRNPVSVQYTTQHPAFASYRCTDQICWGALPSSTLNESANVVGDPTCCRLSIMITTGTTWSHDITVVVVESRDPVDRHWSLNDVKYCLNSRPDFWSTLNVDTTPGSVISRPDLLANNNNTHYTQFWHHFYIRQLCVGL